MDSSAVEVALKMSFPLFIKNMGENRPLFSILYSTPTMERLIGALSVGDVELL